MPKNFAPTSGGFTVPLRLISSVASVPKTTQNTCRFHDVVNTLNQNGRSLRRPEIGHACNSTQAHMQGKQREWRCVTVSKDQAHINNSEKPWHEDWQSQLFVLASVFIYSHFIPRSSRDISSLSLPLLSVYNQTIFPFMLTFALLSYIVHNGFI